MHAADMLHEVFAAGEPRARATLAVGVGAHAAGFGAAVLAVDLALVAVQAAGVGEAAVFAAGSFTGVGTGVLVHVLAIRLVSGLVRAGWRG